jgi:pimeloyl-ACP methyl ester carboxylesterase
MLFWLEQNGKVGREKLLYHGVSYGTVLGQLFAHLHPDRVSRIVLDAVVDADVYWTANGMPPSANPTTSWNISFEHAQIHPHAHSGKIALKKHVLDSTTS